MNGYGQCLCGAIEFQVQGSLGKVNYCHCLRCRQATGTAFSANAKIRKDQFKIVKGTEKLTEFEQNPGTRRFFCSACGSALYVLLDSEPEIVRLRIGALTGDFDVQINAHVWVESKASWFTIEDSLPVFNQAAPPV
jgi:hypothetical protein